MAESDWTSARVEIQHRTALPNPFIGIAVEVIDPFPVPPDKNPECDEGVKSVQRPPRDCTPEKAESPSPSGLVPLDSTSNAVDEPFGEHALDPLLKTILPIESPVPILDLGSGDHLAPTISGKPLRGIGLLGAVFDELSKQLGTDFSTAELMAAAQQLIDLSKSEYVVNKHKDPADRAGYYSWDLVRAFRSHAWQIVESDTQRLDHCDWDEFAPETMDNIETILQGKNERLWDF
jgi:hypothetical protein